MSTISLLAFVLFEPLTLLAGLAHLFAVVLLDNCSSLYDCWDTLGPAAAAAAGAGAAAVLAGGLLLNSGDGTEVIEEEPGPDSIDATSTIPVAPATTVTADATPGVIPTEASVTTSGTGATEATIATSETGVTATPVVPVEASAASGAPGALPAVDSTTVPPMSLEAVAGLAASTALAGASLSSAARDAASAEEQEEDEEHDECPEADASLFGLPDINTRKDCVGTRHGMSVQYTGIDFSSNDEHGRPTPMPFEACVKGEVTSIGGEFNRIEVTVENGNKIQFLHASEVFVEEGQQVESDTKLGLTGGTGLEGPHQYEIHLHVQAKDKDGKLIDPDCALSGKTNRILRLHQPHPEQEHPAPAQVIQEDTQLEMLPQPVAVEEPAGTGGEVGAIEMLPPTQDSPAFETAASLERQAAVTEVLPNQPSPTAPEASMGATTGANAVDISPVANTGTPAPLYCGNCGQANPPGAIFCARCGQPLQATGSSQAAAPSVIYCNHCGSANPPGSHFCGRCGQAIQLHRG